MGWRTSSETLQHDYFWESFLGIVSSIHFITDDIKWISGKCAIFSFYPVYALWEQFSVVSSL